MKIYISLLLFIILTISFSSCSKDEEEESTTDTTAPTVSVTTATINSSGNAAVQSTETGTAYLVNTSVTVSNLANITGAADSQWNSVTIISANTNTNLAATGLADGTYKAYAVDAAGNISSASANSVTIITSGSTTTATGSISVGSESLTGSYSSSCLTTDRAGTTLSSSVSGGNLPSNTIAMKYYLIVTSSSSLEFSEYFYSDASCLTPNISMAEIWTYFSVGSASGSNYLITYTRYSTSYISYDTTAKTLLDTAFETTTTIGTAHTVLNDSPRKDIIYVSSNSVKIGQSSSSDHPSSVYDTEMTK